MDGAFCLLISEFGFRTSDVRFPTYVFCFCYIPFALSPKPISIFNVLPDLLMGVNAGNAGRDPADDFIGDRVAKTRYFFYADDMALLRTG